MGFIYFFFRNGASYFTNISTYASWHHICMNLLLWLCFDNICNDWYGLLVCNFILNDGCELWFVILVRNSILNQSQRDQFSCQLLQAVLGSNQSFSVGSTEILFLTEATVFLFTAIETSCQFSTQGNFDSRCSSIKNFVWFEQNTNLQWASSQTQKKMKYQSRLMTYCFLILIIKCVYI